MRSQHWSGHSRTQGNSPFSTFTTPRTAGGGSLASLKVTAS